MYTNPISNYNYSIIHIPKHVQLIQITLTHIFSLQDDEELTDIVGNEDQSATLNKQKDTIPF